MLIMTNQVKLVLVRHGQSKWNKENLFTGWADVPLTVQGKKEAREAGELLKNYAFHSAFSSTLSRANDTLSIILERSQTPPPKTTFNWKLNERHYGALEGLNKQQVTKEYGSDQVKIWRRSLDIAPPTLDKKDERYTRHQEKYAYLSENELPLAESLKDTLDRVQPYWETNIKPLLEIGKDVLVVAHGNSLRALAKIIENINNIDILEFNIPTGVPREYTFTADLKLLNASYLGDPKAVAEKAHAIAHQASEQQQK